MKLHSLKFIIIGFALAFPALAQTGGGYDLTWSTIEGGGQMFSAGGSYSLGGTIGQPDAGPTAGPMTGGSYSLVGGFWPAANVCFCLADMNGDGNKDGRDVQKFISCILATGVCACADVDQANGVTLADVPQFVSKLLSSATCP